jgi:hypothetical protein
MSLNIGTGAYAEGFTAFQSGKAATDNPYVLDVEKTTKHNQWNAGHSYASRVCAKCGKSTAKDMVPCYRGSLMTAFGQDGDVQTRYGIGPNECICLACYNLKRPPHEQVIYAWGDNWKESIKKSVEQIEKDQLETPYREVRYYGVPSRHSKRFHAFVIVTNGDRYDIRNPHVSDCADTMIRYRTKEELFQLIDSLE